MHRHSYSNRKLSRKTGPRKALLRGLATSVILYERVKTTLPKAKEVQSIVEKLITKGKKADQASVRALRGYLYGENTVEKLLTEIAPIYKDRNGGYTRIVKVGHRAGDAAPMAIIELVDIDKLAKKEVKAPAKDAKKTEAKPAVKKPETKKPAAKKPVGAKEKK